ncbi:MAG: hypothetical protein L3J39_15230 [Verrucomicrobiales bacterium]|nr:hypothetical protein [Verrucomicrobiales bacterium]
MNTKRNQFYYAGLFTVFLLVHSAFADLGFFESRWVPRPAPVYSTAVTKNQPSRSADITFTANFSVKTAKVLPTHFGNNTNGYISDIYESSFAIENLRQANISILRLPGGNWSNKWFWDGVTPDDIVSGAWVDGHQSLAFKEDENSWIVSTDSMYALAKKIGAEIQPCVNFSYARYNTDPHPVARAASYAASWVRDVKQKGISAPYWEVGNENYGSWQMGYEVNGDTITGTEYGQGFNVFSDSMKAANPTIKIGAVIVEDDEGYGSYNNWTRGVLPEVQDKADFLSLHDYFTWDSDMNSISPQEVLSSIELIQKNKEDVEAMVAKYTDHPGDHFPIAFTEYNMRAGYKNISHVSNLFITMCIHELIRNEYGLVNLWGISNGYNTYEANSGDHGMLARKDPILETGHPNPSFYSYYFSTRFIGDHFVKTSPLQQNGVYLWASRFSGGEGGITIVNTTGKAQLTEVVLQNLYNNGEFEYFQIYADSLLDEIITINGVSGTKRSGPRNYQDIPPFKSAFKRGKLKFLAKPYSTNFLLIKGKKRS